MGNVFFTIEGGEGTGKTTVSKKLIKSLEEKGLSVLLSREPGGVSSAEEIRELIFCEKINPIMECLLFAAARRQHLVEKVIPALNKNTIVLMDRYIDSSLVYQGIAGNLGIEPVFLINKLAISDSLHELDNQTIDFYVDSLVAILKESRESKIFNPYLEKIDSLISSYDLDKLTIVLLKTAIRCYTITEEDCSSLNYKCSELSSLIDNIIKDNSRLNIPSISFFLDIDPVEALVRINQDSTREINRFDNAEMSFHNSVREGYKKIPDFFGDKRNIQFIDADDTIENIHNKIFNTIIDFLK